MPSLEEIMQMAQNAQAELQKAQDNLDKIEVEGQSGGGLVKIKASAKGRIIGVSIDESLLAPSEKTMVEDLIAAALNDTRSKADQAAAAEMQKMSRPCRCRPGSRCRSEPGRLTRPRVTSLSSSSEESIHEHIGRDAASPVAGDAAGRSCRTRAWRA